MKLKDFIKHLNNMAKRHGDSLEVIMADGILVTKPIFSDKYRKPSVVITDNL